MPPLIRNMNCCLLITTRCRFENAFTFELQEITDKETLFHLAEQFFHHASQYKENILEIIEIVHNHTYAVELSARLLQTGMYSPDVVLQKLRDNAVNPDLTDLISSEKDEHFQKYDYYSHIHLLFRLFSLDQTMQYILRCSYFLPVDVIAVRQFADWIIPIISV